MAEEYVEARWLTKAEEYLRRLCVEIPSRRVGSDGNRAATALFAQTVARFGFTTDRVKFDCIDWHEDGVRLTVDGEPFTAFASPYSLGCSARAPLAVVTTITELAEADLHAKVVLLRGEIAGEQLMPKRFPFYNPEHHGQIIALLEEKRPAAIVAATARDPEMVGGAYPFPLFEDGDFDLPSVYMTEVEGERLAARAEREVWLDSLAERIPARGVQIVARKGADPRRRVVLMAHIDSRLGSPGASDNASGVVALLLLAELLADYDGQLGLELVPVNGEDYYACPGERLYLAANAGRFAEILLGINLDDVAYYRGKTAYSLYDCPAVLASRVRQTFASYPDIMEGEPWYQGDHGLFLMNDRPALAITSELLAEVMGEVTHTPKDTPAIVAPARIVSLAFALRDLLGVLGRR